MKLCDPKEPNICCVQIEYNVLDKLKKFLHTKERPECTQMHPPKQIFFGHKVVTSSRLWAMSNFDLKLPNIIAGECCISVLMHTYVVRESAMQVDEAITANNGRFQVDPCS